MVVPNEVRSQRFSVTLGSPRRDFVFDHFPFFFFRRVAQQEEQQLVYAYVYHM